MNAPAGPVTIDRKTFLGGSDAAAILCVSPWSTPLDIFLEKTGLAAPIDDPAREKLFRRGKRLEPIALDMLIEEYGVKVTKRSTPASPNRYIDPEHAFLAAEIDFEWEVTPEIAREHGIDRALIGTIQNGEIKTVHHFASAKFGDEGTEEVPVEYAAQAMHGLMVAGRQITMFGVLVGADNLGVYWIKRDDETIDGMRAREVEFWTKHVLTNVPPAPVNLPDVLKLFKRDRATEVPATKEMAALCEALEAAKQQAAAAEDRIAEAKFELGKFMLGPTAVELQNGGKVRPGVDPKPGKHTLTYFGKALLTVSYQVARRIDSDLLRKRYPDAANDCTYPSTSYVFRAVKEKN